MEDLSAKLPAPKWPTGELPRSLLTTLIEFCVALSCATLAIRRFLGATSRSKNTAELTGFAEALRCMNSILHGERVRILCDSKYAARVALGVAHDRKNIALASRCNDLFCGVKTSFMLPLIVFFWSRWQCWERMR